MPRPRLPGTDPEDSESSSTPPQTDAMRLKRFWWTGVGLAIAAIAATGIALASGTSTAVQPTPTAQPTLVAATPSNDQNTQAIRAVQALTPSVTPAPAATSTPSCPSAATYLQVIIDQERRGQWDAAATNAKTALTARNLCAPDQAQLADHAIVDGRRALTMNPPAPGHPDTAGPTRVRGYRDLKALAQQYRLSGSSSLDPLPLAQEAYDRGEFDLALAALVDAYTAGDWRVTDPSALGFFYAALRNAAFWHAQSADPTEQQRGQRMMVAACQTSRIYQLGNTAGCDDAIRVLGADESRWPKLTGDLILSSSAEVTTR